LVEIAQHEQPNNTQGKSFFQSTSGLQHSTAEYSELRFSLYRHYWCNRLIEL